MPSLAPAAHLTGVLTALEVIERELAEVSLEAPVPTCPGWTVRQLLAHLGTAHRWALSVLAPDPSTPFDPTAAEAEGLGLPGSTELSGWLRSGVERLVSTIEAAPTDLEALVFLKEAGPPRDFWARRQCHESTIHAIDVIAARTGAPVSADEVTVSDALALDGVDELLVGFWQRGRSSPHTASRERTLVSAADRAWLLHSSEEPLRVHSFRLKDPEAAYEVDAVISGDPVDLYLAVWNRGGQVLDSAGRLQAWHDAAAIRWS